MKKYPFAVLTSFIGGFSLCFAAEEQQSPSKQPPAESSTARILGDIPDGTLPLPEPPKSIFIVPAKDVLEIRTYEQGGRTITVRKIAPIALPPQAKTAPPVDINDSAIQQRIAQVIEESPADEFLCAGATVFYPKNSDPLSHVQIWPQGKGESIVLWSTADFGLLSGVSSFVGADGGTRSLMLMWGITEIDTCDSLQTELGPDAPKIPLLPPGKATFSIISGVPSPQTLASIQSLHDLYNNEYDRLKTAYDGRERAHREREAELKAHPPKSKDITINYWRIVPGQATMQKGAAQ